MLQLALTLAAAGCYAIAAQVGTPPPAGLQTPACPAAGGNGSTSLHWPTPIAVFRPRPGDESAAFAAHLQALRVLLPVLRRHDPGPAPGWTGCSPVCFCFEVPEIMLRQEQ